MINIKFKGKYFDTMKNAVHVDDYYVQKMIDDVINYLLTTDSNDDFNFYSTSTGDTLVYGVKYRDDDGIDIIVTQDYNQVTLLKNERGEYEPIDWYGQESDLGEETDSMGTISNEELMNEIRSLRQELDSLRKAQYNPRREV